MYRLLDDGLPVLRAPARDSAIPLLPDCDSTNIVIRRGWLTDVWSDGLADAITMASPSLAASVRAIITGQERRPRRVRRATESVLRYALRAQHRSTPCGLFAGVTACRFGDQVTATVTDDHRAVASVDREWLSDVVGALEQSWPLLKRLSVVTSPLACARNARLVIAWPPGMANGAAGTDTAPSEVTVRETMAVGFVRRYAASPVPVADLTAALLRDLSTVPEVTVREAEVAGFLTTLVRAGFLVTSLRPPATATAPLTDLLTTLRRVQAHHLPDTAAAISTLAEADQAVQTHNTSACAKTRRDLRAYASRAMNDAQPLPRPLTVDLALDGDITLPHAVAATAATAADLLSRLTPDPAGTPAWRAYHQRILERFGVGACIPIGELVDAERGVGYPAGYRDSTLSTPAQPLQPRDAVLLRLAQQAALASRQEVELDDATVAELAGQTPDRSGRDRHLGPQQPHVDLCVRIQASSLEALSHGDFELIVVTAHRNAAAMTGRFLHLLAPSPDSPETTPWQLPTATEGALAVQVSCPPLFTATGNVTPAARRLRYQLAIAEHPNTEHANTESTDQDLSLAELAVVADVDRLYLWSTRLHRFIEPVMLSAVEFARVHPLARLLVELPHALTAHCAPFSWGAAATLPFLPRLRYGRIILAPASWMLPATAPSAAASDADWTTWLRDCQAALNLPDAIVVAERDQHLRLDLTDPTHRRLLRAALEQARERGTGLRLHEAPAPSADGWLGRPHELVLPLGSTQQPGRPPVHEQPTSSYPQFDDARPHRPVHLPGEGSCLLAKLYCHPDRANDILTEHLDTYLWSAKPRTWWFVRYRDPEPHLRLYLRRSESAGFTSIATRLTTWADELHDYGLISRLCIDTAYCETGRYGNGAALDAAEAVFAADSALAVAQLRHHPPAHWCAITATNLVSLACHLLADTPTALTWLVDHLPRGAATIDRADVESALRGAPSPDLAAPGPDAPARIHTRWAKRRAALGRYRQTLLSQTDAPTPDQVLPSLIHMHVIRMHGVSPSSETACRAVARQVALAMRDRPAPLSHEDRP